MRAVEFRTRTAVARPRDEAWRDSSEVTAQHVEPERSASGGLSPLSIGVGAAAVALAGAAILNHRRGRAAERAHPPVGRFMEVDGIHVHYVERGAGRPVVLLHGNGAMVHDFLLSGLMDRLAESYRVIAIDRPGFGYSERPRGRAWTAAAQAALLRRVAQRLGAERPIVVGHSWGAIVATAWALDYQHELAGTVLLSGYYYPTPRRDVLVFAAPAIPVIGDVLRYTISPPLGRLILPRLAEKIFAPRPIPHRFLTEYPFDLSLRPWQLRASSEEVALMIPTAANAQGRYGELRLPVAILTGDDDRVVTCHRQSMRLHEDIPHSSLRVLPGLGHMIHYFAQDEIAASIDAVLGDAGRARPPYAVAASTRDPAPALLAGESVHDRATIRSAPTPGAM
jgi:pimeloyl-ACP methyl ester carboxylesterase